MTLLAETTVFSDMPWRLLPPLVLAALAVFFLLPRPRGRSVALGAFSGIAALVLGGIVSLRVEGAFSAEAFLFYVFSGLAILGGALMVTQRNPARAAISFALVVMNVCGLFLLQAAPFLMAATIIIYAGAIIVTFLFVLMLAQPTGFSDADDRSREPFAASFVAFILLGAVLLLLDHAFPNPRRLDELLERMAQAARRETNAEIIESLGDRAKFLDDLKREGKRFRGSVHHKRWDEAVDDVHAEMNSNKSTVNSLREDLNRLADVGRIMRQEDRGAALPAENVAAIGRLLFSDYILGVELAGTLLLVATIGAIAISARRVGGAA